MTQRIALVQMPPWDTESPPLALATVASMLRRKHVEIKCFDFNKALNKEQWKMFYDNGDTFLQDNLLNLLFPEHYPSFNKKLKDFASKIDCFLDASLDKITSFKPDIVAFSICTYAIQTFCLLLSKRIKMLDHNIKIVFGGAMYAQNLNNDLPLKTGFVDEIVPKGEEGKFFEKFEDKTNYDFDPDIVYFDLFNLKEYNRILPMVWTEGCNMKCKFCVHSVIVGVHKTFDINKIIKQIKFYIKQYGIKRFYLNDSNPNQNPKFLSEVCDRIINERLGISWDCRFYVNPNIKVDLFKKMAKSGCKNVFIGLESGSQKVLDELNKGFAVDMAKDTIKRLYEHGIKVNVSIVIGSHYENHKDYLETLKVLHEIRKYISSISHIVPLYYGRGSQFYLEAKKSEQFKADIPEDLKEYAEYFPYISYPEPTSSKSTIMDRRYLRNVTFDIFNSDFKTKRSPLVIDEIYYDGNEIIKLGDDKVDGYYYLKLPRDNGKLESIIKAKKKVKIILDIDYTYYLSRRKRLVNYLNDAANITNLKLCRPVPVCFKSDELALKYSLSYKCKDCMAYLYLNKDEKILYCREKFWDYYVNNKNTSLTSVCKACMYRKRNRCKMHCVQYLTNRPL